MNKKNKVLLSTVGLLLLSGIAATSSTFAWFTTVRSATINYSEATAQTTSGNLNILYKESATSGISAAVDGTDSNLVTLTGVNNLVTDISGDGKTFYKPVWASQTSSSVGVASVINTVAAADGHYIDFTFTISRSNADDGPGLKVYLGTGTTITDGAAVAGDIVPTLRLAVLVGGNVVVRWAPVEETNPTYLTTGSGAYGTSTHSITPDSTLKSGTIVTQTTQALADAHGYPVVNLATGAANKSADVTFRVWIEGTDAQTDNAIIGEKLSLALKLYALEA